MLTEQQACTEVERALGSRLTPKERQYLIEDDLLSDVQRVTAEGLDCAVTQIRRLRETFGNAAPGPSGRMRFRRPVSSDWQPSQPLLWLQAALTEVFAAHALQADASPRMLDGRPAPEGADSSGILAFRRDHLRGRLLTPEAAGPWVKDRATQEGPATSYHERGRDGSESWRVETLAYGIAGDRWTHHVPIREKGTLDALRNVGDRLAGFYGWTEAQATFFVLTGQPPLVPAIRTIVTIAAPLTQARSRITLTINPACSPRDVAAAYRAVQRQNFGRRRKLSEKHARLAAWYFAQPEETSAADLMAAWNQAARTWKHGPWRYRNASQFQRDAHRAMGRLIG